jgi:sugar phosphate isomerase/epimerase
MFSSKSAIQFFPEFVHSLHMNSTQSSLPTWWGFAGVFPGALGVYNQGDVFTNKLTWVAERGFHGGHVGPESLSNPDHRALMDALTASHQQAWFVGFHPDLTQPVAEVQTHLRTQADEMIAARHSLDLPIASVVVPGGLHRFMRDFPLADQLNRLELLLTPLVEHLSAEGITVAIENHGDYYISDLVELCGRVPGLTIQLDTGNCFLTGERPDLIPDEAYPLVSCTHFKDHFVFPSAKDLNFNLTGATLGEGHVELEKMFNKLIDLHDDPASIRLATEWVPDPGKSVQACFNASAKFLQRLSGGQYTPNLLEEVSV